MTQYILRSRRSEKPQVVETNADEKWVFDSLVEHLRITPSDVYSFSKSLRNDETPDTPSLWDPGAREELIFKMRDAPMLSNEARCVLASEIMSEKFVLSYDDTKYRMSAVSRRAFDELIEAGLLEEGMESRGDTAAFVFTMTEAGKDYPRDVPKYFKEAFGNFTIFEKTEPEPHMPEMEL